MKTYLIAVAVVLLGLTGQASATDEFKLAMKSGCLVCHRGVDDRIGPPFAAIAKKYTGVKDAEALLVEHMTKGTGPNGLGWDKLAKTKMPYMPANDQLSPQDATRLAKWVLTVDKEILDPMQLMSASVAITGAVKNKLTLTVSDLKKFPSVQIGETPVICESGATMSKMNNARGVLLRDILAKAEFIAPDPNDVRKMAFIATSTDGYKAVFSWAEIFNSPIGDGVIAFYERNGLPLTGDEGQIALISTKDTRNGPRLIYWLNGIEVRKLAD
jgi:cytochrome c551/c552